MKAIRLSLEDLGEAWVQRLDQASLMASVPFANLWGTVGGRSVFWGVEDAGHIVAILPGVEFRPSPVKRFQAMPDGLFSNLVCTENSTPYRHQVAKSLLTALRSAAYAKVYVTDYFGELGSYEGITELDCCTTVIPITPTWEPPDAKLRSELRKAEREGVIIQLFDTASSMSSFLELVRETERRHGQRPRYPDAFFLGLADLATQDTRVKWLFVEHDGQPVVSHIYLLERDTLLNWQIYYDKQFSFLKANQYVLYTMARECAKSGITKLNLGMTPIDADGVKAYKEKWGGQSHRYRQLCAVSALGRLF